MQLPKVVCTSLSFLRQSTSIQSNGSYNKARILLSWFVGDELDSLIVSDSETAEKSMLPKSPKDLPDSIREEVVRTDVLEMFVSKDFLTQINRLVHMKKKSKRWVCGTCNNMLENGRSIICERCLTWSHFSCTNLSQKPSDDWFCARCIDSVTGIK